MFTFNFLPEDEGKGETSAKEEAVGANPPAVEDDEVTHPFVLWKESDLESFLEKRSSQEIVYQDIELFPSQEEDSDDDKNSDEDHPLRRVCMEQYEKEIKPGVYEGGLQVWECSLDLIRYFQKEKIGLAKGSSALELGCGHALPSCWLLREAIRTHGPKEQSTTVVFVDYNDYVIEDVTLSNIILNTGHLLPNVKQLAQWIDVGAGDWHDMSSHFEGRRFDCIIAAETTYTPQAAKDTAQLLLRHLTIDAGIGWVASKRYYFGVGGGTDALREAAQTLQGDEYSLQVETASVVDSGAGNIREILKVTCHRRRDSNTGTAK